jgi:hypothetical protein
MPGIIGVKPATLTYAICEYANSVKYGLGSHLRNALLPAKF